MARTRSSAYGNILGQIPDWVFGGEFGDISNLLNARDMGYEKLQAQELQNDENQLDLENKRRRADLQEELRKRDIFGGNQDAPLTLRDMYGRVRDASRDLGSVEDYIQMQEKIEAIDRQQKLDKQQEDYKAALTASIGRRGAGGSGSKAYNAYNAETGQIDLNISAAEAEALAAADSNWVITGGRAGDPAARKKFEEAQQKKAEKDRKRQAENQGPGWWQQIKGAFSGSKPAEEAIKQQKQATEDLKNNAPGGKSTAKADIQVPPGYELRKDKAGNPVLVKLRKG